MSSDQIPYPHAFIDYYGPIRITYQHANGTESRATQPVGPIDRRPLGCEDEPRIIAQAIDNGQRENGSAWTWDQELDHGRGAWVTYDPGVHSAPESSAALPDVGTESSSIDLSAEETVELKADAAPESAVPVSNIILDDVDCEDEDVVEEPEPSYVEDEDEED